MIDVTSTVSRSDLEQDVNEDINAFETFCLDHLKFEQKLTPSERSIIKTYLGFKLKVADEPTGKTAGMEESHGA